MGNAESVGVQKRLARFRPEDRPAVEGAFARLQTGAGGPCAAPGKTLTLEALQVRLPLTILLWSISTADQILFMKHGRY